jgi:hypothetical protein
MRLWLLAAAALLHAVVEVLRCIDDRAKSCF